MREAHRGCLVRRWLLHWGGGILLPPGAYTVRAESQKYGVVTRTVAVEANKVTVIPLEKK